MSDLTRTPGNRPMLLRTQIQFSRLLLASFLLCILTTSLRSQSPQTSVSGTVLRKTGTHVANAHVSLKNVASGETQTVVGKDDGSFTAGNVSPGTYEVIVSAPAFADWKTTVTIREGANQLMHIVLEDAATGPAEKRQGETSGVSEVVSFLRA